MHKRQLEVFRRQGIQRMFGRAMLIQQPIRQASTAATAQIQDQQQQPREPSREKKTAVRFNLSRLSTLSGYEKILLFGDYAKHRMVEEALVVYKDMRASGLVYQLKYKDHHDMFHMLMGRPNAYEDEMKWIVKYLDEIGVVPSVDMLERIVVMSRKWADAEMAEWAIKKIVGLKKQMEIDGWNAWMALLLDLGENGRVVKVFERMHSNLSRDRPNNSSEPSEKTTNQIDSSAKTTDSSPTCDDDLLKAISSSLSPNHTSYMLAIQAYSNLKLPTHILMLYHSHSHNLQTTDNQSINLITAVVAALTNAEDFHRASNVVKTTFFNDKMYPYLQKTSMSSLQNIAAVLLKLAEKSDDTHLFPLTLRKISQLSIPFNHTILGRIISNHAKTDNIVQVRKTFEKTFNYLNLAPSSHAIHDKPLVAKQIIHPLATEPILDSVSPTAKPAPSYFHHTIYTAYLRSFIKYHPTKESVSIANQFFYNTYRRSIPQSKPILKMIYQDMIDANTRVGLLDKAKLIQLEMDSVYNHSSGDSKDSKGLKHQDHPMDSPENSQELQSTS